MNFISEIFGYLLKFLYDISGHYAVAIILFTIITKVILLPFTVMQTKSTTHMKRVQPLLNAINEKYKDNPQKQSEMLQGVYSKYNINPMSGCLPLLIQLPITIALLKTMREPVEFVFGSKAAYEAADQGMLWIDKLSSPDIIKFGNIPLPFILPILTALIQFLQMKMSIGKQDDSQAASMQRNMMFVFPLMMLFWGVSFPSGLMLYWFTGTLIQIAMQAIIEKTAPEEDQDIAKQMSEDIENLKKVTKKSKSKKPRLAKTSRNFYDEYTPSKDKEVKRVRRIPKKNIVDSTDVES